MYIQMNLRLFPVLNIFGSVRPQHVNTQGVEMSVCHFVSSLIVKLLDLSYLSALSCLSL